MKSTIILIAGAAFALGGCMSEKSPADKNAQPVAARPSDAESEAYMRKAEEDWAQTFVRDDPALLQRVLADDFKGIFSNGTVHGKAETIAAEKPDPAYASARLDVATYRHYGETVIAQGVESAQRKDGGPDLRLVWTDVWLWRDGKWQVVASHVSRLGEKR